MRAVDCQGLAGAFTLGTAQAGWNVVAKKELPGGFGVENVRANQRMVNPKLEYEIGPWEEWEPEDVEYVFGNPPCSGFSLMNQAASFARRRGKESRQARGPDSAINDCMWALAQYAGRVRPSYVAMESVQQAYTNGRSLMQKLRAKTEDISRSNYDLVHLKVSGTALGAYQRRHRYYMLLRRADAPPLRFGKVEHRTGRTYWDAIGDLVGMANTWESQPYKFTGHPLQSPDGTVDSHVSPTLEAGTKHCTQVYNLLASGLWNQGEAMSVALRRYHDRYGTVPTGFDLERIVAKNWELGFHQPRRVRWDQEGYVVTGSGGYDFIHPSEDRFMTVREVARLQGFPDAWSFRGAGDRPNVPYAWIGKGVPVQMGNWVSRQVGASLTGAVDREEYEPEVIGDREYLYDLTYAWRAA